MQIGKEKDAFPPFFPARAEYCSGEDRTNPQNASADVTSDGDEHTD